MAHARATTHLAISPYCLNLTGSGHCGVADACDSGRHVRCVLAYPSATVQGESASVQLCWVICESTGIMPRVWRFLLPAVPSATHLSVHTLVPVTPVGTNVRTVLGSVLLLSASESLPLATQGAKESECDKAAALLAGTGRTCSRLSQWLLQVYLLNSCPARQGMQHCCLCCVVSAYLR